MTEQDGQTAQDGTNLPCLVSLEREDLEKAPWRDDRLGRKDMAPTLTRLVQSQHGRPFVLSLDGAWGTGKTFFLKRWYEDLQDQEFQAIYFNAWEDDFHQDPLVAIVGQLVKHWRENDSRMSDVAKQNLVRLPALLPGEKPPFQ